MTTNSYSDTTSPLLDRLDIGFALKAARLGVWELDPITKIVNWDERCRRLFGLAANNLLPYEQAIRYIHPDDVERVDQAVHQALSPESDGNYDVTHRTIGADDGILRWVRFMGQSYFNEAGEVIRFAGVAQDVTHEVDHDTQAKQLVASEARFRNLLTEAPVAFFLLRGDTFEIELANKKVLELWGRSREEALNKPVLEVLPELVSQGFGTILGQVLRTGNPVVANEMLITLLRYGIPQSLYYNFTYELVKGSNGQPDGILGVGIEVTEQVLARKAIEESGKYFQQLIDSIPAIIWETRPDGYCTYLNKQWYDATGQTREAAEGFGWLDATHPADTAEAGRLFREANQSQSSFEFLYRLRLKDGSYRWAIDQGSPRFDASGVYEGMIGTVTDVHDQKIAEEEVTRFKYMADNASDPFILMRHDGTFAYLNQLALDRWGYSAEEATTIRVPDVDPIYTDAVFSAAFARAQTESIPPFETLHRKKDGTIYPVEVNMGGLMLGNEPHMFAIARDITERKQVEEVLKESEARFRTLSTELDQLVEQRTQQLRSSVQDLQRSNDNLQQFAYVASHDLQEPLRKIQSFGDILQRQYGEQIGEGGNDFLNRMQKSASRMSTLIRDLLTYSRISTQQDSSSPVVLGKVIEIVLNDLDLIIQETGAVVEVDPLPTVQGDRSQLGQLFQNLINNAIKFRQPNQPPHITITCTTLAATKLPSSVRPTREAPAYYCIEVTDNGIGFDEKYADRIFQVFQRLHGKSQYAGTGIGLAICEKVAANHGGAITATSKPGQGASFSIYLPT